MIMNICLLFLLILNNLKCTLKNEIMKNYLKNLFNLKNKTKYIFQFVLVMFIDNVTIIESWQKLVWPRMVL